jgi:hypothetical protein
MYCYSNNGLSMRAVEALYAAQAGEVLFQTIPTDAELQAAFSSYASAHAVVNIREQIAAIERQITPRLMREAFLGVTSVISDGPYHGQTAAQAVASAQGAITALRAQLTT